MRYCAAFCLLLLSACTPRATGPEIKDGLLDLRARSISDEGPFELSGDWHFYWKKFVLPDESSAGAETIRAGDMDGWR